MCTTSTMNVIDLPNDMLKLVAAQLSSGSIADYNNWRTTCKTVYVCAKHYLCWAYRSSVLICELVDEWLYPGGMSTFNKQVVIERPGRALCSIDRALDIILARRSPSYGPPDTVNIAVFCINEPPDELGNIADFSGLLLANGRYLDKLHTGSCAAVRRSQVRGENILYTMQLTAVVIGDGQTRIDAVKFNSVWIHDGIPSGSANLGSLADWNDHKKYLILSISRWKSRVPWLPITKYIVG